MDSALKKAWMLAAIMVFGAYEGHSQVPQWHLAPELRIGGLNSSDASLTEVRSVVADGEGRIYVSQPQEGLVRVFDEHGAFVRTIGRRGSGPGEFQQLGSIGLVGDSLYAVDLVLQRISVFRTDGSHIRTLAVTSPPLEGFRAAGPIAILADGSIVAQPTVSPRMTASGGLRIPVLRLSQEGEVLDTFPNLPMPADNVVIVRLSDRTAYLNRPFVERPITAVAPDGSAVAFVHQTPAASGGNSSFSIIRLSQPNQETFRRSISYSPIPVPIQVSDSIRTIHITELSQFISRAEAERNVRDLVPQYQPPVSRVLAGTDSTVWIQREAYGNEAANWLVLDSNGTSLATVRILNNVVLHAVARDYVFGVDKDEFDVPYVIRYRIVR